MFSVHVNAGIGYLVSLIYAYNWHQVYLLIHYVNISFIPFITDFIATIQQYTNMTLRSNLRFSKGVAFCNWNCPTTAPNLPLLSIVYDFNMLLPVLGELNYRPHPLHPHNYKCSAQAIIMVYSNSVCIISFGPHAIILSKQVTNNGRSDIDII